MKNKLKREIKFEGKVVGSTNIWCEGDLYQCDNGKVLIAVHLDEEESKGYYHQDENLHASEFEVYPETVGEFSGFKDHHGRDLYENNIVRVTENINGKMKTFNEVICFKNGCFSLYNPNCCEVCKNGFGITCELSYAFACFEKIEFIGRYPYDKYLLKN